MVVHLRVKEIAKEKGFNMGKLQRDADVEYNTVKRMFKDPYYFTTTETLGKLARALGFHQESSSKKYRMPFPTKVSSTFVIAMIQANPSERARDGKEKQGYDH
jgi:Cro/C1-type HTH DNA-binding domain